MTEHNDQFPRGKLNDDDEGELEIGIIAIDKTVVIRFAKHVSWIGMDAQQAKAFAETIIRKAEECQ